jgi:hypothetical protein
LLSYVVGLVVVIVLIILLFLEEMLLFLSWVAASARTLSVLDFLDHLRDLGWLQLLGW